MDKAMQDNKELRDEELYALLDRAWETDERLCVSEDLIQKTLKRAAEEKDSKVISFETAAKRKISPMKYVGVAVAAVFVAVLGVNAFGNGGFVANDVKMEATADGTGQKLDSMSIQYDSSEASTAMVNNADKPGNKSYYSRSGDEGDLLADIGTDVSVPLEAPEENSESEAVGGEVEMSAMTLELSQRSAGVLKDAGMAPVSDNVECWAFADVETDWERELLNSLAAGVLWGNQRPEYGTYRYMLEGKDDARYVMEYNAPLDLIVRIETEKGVLWGFLGADSFFFTE